MSANQNTTNDAALVLFSGGQDSTTCLAWALDRFSNVETVGFDYGQRHLVEMNARTGVLQALRDTYQIWSDKLGSDHVLTIDALTRVSDTSLTRDVAIAIEANGLPNSFVPGRNLLFLTFAAALAYRRGTKHLVLGVCETDYSGYPDCRDDTIKAMQIALNLGMEARFVVHTPLMFIDKAATWTLAERLGGSRFIDLILHETHTCYNGDRSILREWGYGCGQCPACELRASGWRRYCEARTRA
jgi:7-cyano-7-deazaguanine synthase